MEKENRMLREAASIIAKINEEAESKHRLTQIHELIVIILGLFAFIGLMIYYLFECCMTIS